MYTVAIVGRPNVGKSALFNRIVGKRIAIVDSTYGLTRDRITAPVVIDGCRFTLIDTGGIDFDEVDSIREMARKQSQLAIDQADLVLLVTDVQQGLVPLDAEITQMLRNAGVKVIVVVNKADNDTLAVGASEFHALGLPEIVPVSAAHGIGIQKLIDLITAEIPKVERSPEERIKIAVLGKPNVGKSSFVNAVIREERLIVNEIPGTTRDAVDIQTEWKGKLLTLIDTAGVRKSKKVREPADYFGVARTKTSLSRCDCVLLIIDAEQGVTTQDEKIARSIIDEGKGCVLAANKWDVIENKDIKAFRRRIWDKLVFLNFAPLVIISAKYGKGITQSLNALLLVYEERRKRMSTGLVNRVLHDLWKRSEPPVRKGKRPKLFYATQADTAPPRFTLFVNNSALIHRTYGNYLSNGLRRAFGFEGVPIFIHYKNRGQAPGER
jgi:GTP-binding protein